VVLSSKTDRFEYGTLSRDVELEIVTETEPGINLNWVILEKIIKNTFFAEKIVPVALPITKIPESQVEKLDLVRTVEKMEIEEDLKPVEFPETKSITRGCILVKN